MRDEERDQEADEETGPGTPLHAYAEGREEDVEGDVDKLTSGDPEQLQRDEVAEDESSAEHIEPPPKA
jgi:hypothetical protein